MFGNRVTSERLRTDRGSFQVMFTTGVHTHMHACTYVHTHTHTYIYRRKEFLWWRLALRPKDLFGCVSSALLDGKHRNFETTKASNTAAACQLSLAPTCHTAAGEHTAQLWTTTCRHYGNKEQKNAGSLECNGLEADLLARRGLRCL